MDDVLIRQKTKDRRKMSLAAMKNDGNGNGKNDSVIDKMIRDGIPNDVDVDEEQVVGDIVDSGERGELTTGRRKMLERKLVWKIDWRLCTIAGILCSLNLLDSGIISSASVTSIFADLGLGVGNRYVSLGQSFEGRVEWLILIASRCRFWSILLPVWLFSCLLRLL